MHMTPPNGPCLVCPPSSPFHVEMTLKVSTPPLIVVENDLVKALRADLAKCKLDHKRELELVHMENVNEVHRLKAWIETLTNLARG